MSLAEVAAWIKTQPLQLPLSPDTTGPGVPDRRLGAAMKRFKISRTRAHAALEEARR